MATMPSSLPMFKEFLNTNEDSKACRDSRWLRKWGIVTIVSWHYWS
jgi:hypothetical protein